MGFEKIIRGGKSKSGRGWVVKPRQTCHCSLCSQTRVLVYESNSRSSELPYVEIKLIVVLVSEEVVVMGVDSKLPICPAEILFDQITTGIFPADNFEEGVNTWEAKGEKFVKVCFFRNAFVDGGSSRKS